MNTSLNWLKKKKNISSHCFDEVQSFHFHCGCILRWPVWLRQSVIALLYSGLQTRDGREGEGAEGRMTEEREFRVLCQGDEGCPHFSSTTVIKNQSDWLFSRAVHKPSLAHALKRPDFSQQLVFLRSPPPGDQVHPSSIKISCNRMGRAPPSSVKLTVLFV